MHPLVHDVIFLHTIADGSTDRIVPSGQHRHPEPEVKLDRIACLDTDWIITMGQIAVVSK